MKAKVWGRNKEKYYAAGWSKVHYHFLPNISHVVLPPRYVALHRMFAGDVLHDDLVAKLEATPSGTRTALDVWIDGGRMWLIRTGLLRMEVE